jgi:hypothetical protein
MTPTAAAAAGTFERFAIYSVCRLHVQRSSIHSIDLSTAPAALWFYLAVLTGWFISAGTRGFLHLYAYLDTLPPRKKSHTNMSTSRPRPLRTAASIIGGITALLSGLVGSGLLTAGQGDALTGIITAVLAVLAAFGITVSTERKVTPLADPRDHDGQPLIPAQSTNTD